MQPIVHANVTLKVSDINASIRFYTETLGFSLKGIYGEHWAELNGPGITVGLHPAEKLNAKDTMTFAIGLGVNDFEDWVNVLKEKNIELQFRNEGTRLAFFSDPDGNPLYIADIS